MCGEAGDVRQSRVTPKFFGDWIKRTSTGRLVNGASPAKRGQDAAKARVLCDRCEERFSKHEAWFADNIFSPFHSGSRSFEYDRNLGLFAASLSWRALKHSYDEVKASSSHLVPLLDDAERCWRDFLLEKRQTNPYENHLLFLDSVKGDGPLDADDRHEFRAVEATLRTSSNRAFAYVRMPRMLIVASVFPLNMDGWKGTLIKTSGQMTASQTVDDAGFRKFYRERAHGSLACSPGPSDEARTKLEKALKDPPRVLKSQMYQIWAKEADADLKKRVDGLPRAVRELIERVITGAVADPKARDEYDRGALWASRHVVDRLAGLSGEEARELDQAIVATMDESTAAQKYARRGWNAGSLQVVFMVRHGATREHQHSRIRDEIEDLRRRTPSEVPIGVFSMNYEGDGCSFESGFSVCRPRLSH